MTDPKFMVFNGDVVPFADATVHVTTPAVKYGIGVFEGLRGYWNDALNEMFVFRLRDHLERLKQSMKLLRLEDDYSVEALESAVLSMIRANDFRTTIQIRVMAILDGQHGHRTDTGPVTLCAHGTPCPPHPFLDTGLTACTSSWVRTSDNALPARIKCNANYINGRLAELEARAGGFDRAILLNSRGKVSEGPGATLFVIRNNTPVTPGVTSDILESITRDTLIHLLQEHFALATEQRDVDRTEIYTADEAFLCGTLAEVTPIVSLDGVPIGTGSVGTVTRALQQRYLEIVRGDVPDHAEWRMPVYQAAKAQSD